MTESDNTAQVTFERLSAISARLGSALISAEEAAEGLPQFEVLVDADAVRAAIRSLDALASDVVTGVEVLPPNMPNRSLTMALVAKTVSSVFEVPLADFITPYRLKKRNVQAQRATAHLIRKHIPHKSLPQIASFMRKRDHSTIHHTIKVASVHINWDVEFAHLVGVAEHRLLSHA